MAVIVERAVVAVVKIKAGSQQEADAAFEALRDRIEWNVPATYIYSPPTSARTRLKVVARKVTVRTVSTRGVIGKTL